MKPTTQKDDKLKPLLPSLRTKKRFLLISIKSEHKFSFKEISSSLQDELISLLGSLYLGESGFWLLPDSFDFDKQQFVCRISLDSKEKVLGALAVISHLEKYSVALRVISVSGTLKGLLK